MKKVGWFGCSWDEFLWWLSNVEIWVSVVLIDEIMCFDGFDGKVMDGVVKLVIRRRVVYVVWVISNVLVFVNWFVVWY